MVRWEQDCEQSLDASTECTQVSLSCGMEPELRSEGGQGPGANFPSFYLVPAWNSEKFKNSVFEPGLSHCYEGLFVSIGGWNIFYFIVCWCDL